MPSLLFPILSEMNREACIFDGQWTPPHGHRCRPCGVPPFQKHSRYVAVAFVIIGVGFWHYLSYVRNRKIGAFYGLISSWKRL